MRMKFLVVLLFMLTILNSRGQQNAAYDRNMHTSNWVVTDALGRTIPAFEAVGPVRENRKVGVFYYLWSGFHGTPTPDICFLTNTNSGKTINAIYDELYSKELYKDLWFYWNGKPLIMGKTDDTILRSEVRDFFTIKYSWAWTKTQTEPNHWQWLDKYPQDWGWSIQASKPEQITVSVAHHPSNPLGKSYHDGSQPEVNADYLTQFTGEGLQFEQQWSRALQVDPEVVMVTQWNEWLTQRFTWDNSKTSYGGRPINQGDTHFVDVFTAEFNLDMAPMKGGYTDNYYYQLVGKIRQYKGMEAPQTTSPSKTMVVDGSFSEWAEVTPSFCDPVDDTKHRDFEGYDKSVPRTSVNLQDILPDFYFKWADNPGELTDVTTFFLNGDAAPDRRFKYHFNAKDQATSLHQMNNGDNSIKVFPNPTVDKLRVVFKKESELEIFNLLGRRIFESSGFASSFELDVKTWPKGVYMAKASLTANHSTCKFLIQ